MPSGGGYGSQTLKDLTIIENRSYNFKIDYPTYELTVKGDTDLDGKFDDFTETLEAKYGQAFDFSKLEEKYPGEDGNGVYTKFANITTNDTVKVKVGEDNNGNPIYRNEVIDLTQPINAKVAEALEDGVVAYANYVDDSVTAYYSFAGITENDVSVKLRKGEVPSTKVVMDVIEKVNADNEEVYQGEVAISKISPDLGPIQNTSHFTVTCVRPSGDRNTVHFDLQGGSFNNDPANFTMDKLVGSLLVNLPPKDETETVERTGYDFDGWYTAPKAEDELFGQTGANALTQTVPAKQYTFPVGEPGSGEGAANLPLTPGAGTPVKPGADLVRPTEPVTPVKPTVQIPYTLYAQWTPKTYKVTFDLNGGTKLLMRDSATDTTIDPKNDEEAPNTMTVVYDNAFGKAYEYTNPNTDLDGNGKFNLKDLKNADFYGPLPTAYSTAAYEDPANISEDGNTGVTFAGWYWDKDGDNVWFEDGELVTDETIFDHVGDITLRARWKTLVQIPKTIYTVVGGEERTYSSSPEYTGYEPTITYQGNSSDLLGTGVYYYTDAPSTYYYVDFPDEGYTMYYKAQHSDEYIREGEKPHVAGVYDTNIRRAADEIFAAMDWYYNGNNQVLVIKKESSSIGSVVPRATVHNNAVFVDYTGSYTGDGPIEFRIKRIDGDWSAWSHNGAFYDLNMGTYELQARVGDGMNYAESAASDSASFTISSSLNTIHYEVRIKTGGSSAGTDANIYAVIGGKSTHLDKSGYNDFENGDEDSYAITVPNSHDMSSGSTTVSIKFDATGESAVDGWHWKMEWIQLDAYRGSSHIKTFGRHNGQEYDQKEMTVPYSFSGVGRGLNTDCGLNLSSNYIKITNNLTVSDNYVSNYDPYTYANAPRFVAYFSNPIFNAYITRTSLYEFYVDWNGVERAMDEYRIAELTLHYGIEYAASGGVMGATGDMDSEKVEISLPLTPKTRMMSAMPTADLTDPAENDTLTEFDDSDDSDNSSDSVIPDVPVVPDGSTSLINPVEPVDPIGGPALIVPDEFTAPIDGPALITPVVPDGSTSLIDPDPGA